MAEGKLLEAVGTRDFIFESTEVLKRWFISAPIVNSNVCYCVIMLVHILEIHNPLLLLCLALMLNESLSQRGKKGIYIEVISLLWLVNTKVQNRKYKFTSSCTGNKMM